MRSTDRKRFFLLLPQTRVFFAQELFLSSDVQRGAGGSCCCCCCCFLTTKLWRLVFWGFFLFYWSQHLCFRSHGSAAKMVGGGQKKNVSGESGTDEPERCQHTSSIHAGSPYFIHTLQWARAFQTHYQSSNYFMEKKG